MIICERVTPFSSLFFLFLRFPFFSLSPFADFFPLHDYPLQRRMMPFPLLISASLEGTDGSREQRFQLSVPLD